MIIHILFHHSEHVFQSYMLHPDHLAEEAFKEDRVASLIDQLGGQEDAHIILWHSGDIRGQGIGDALFPFEEGREAVDAHTVLIFAHTVPLFTILAEVDLLRAPLLALPTIIEFTIGWEMNQALINNIEHTINRCLL